jgi:hypothetical protein
LRGKSRLRRQTHMTTKSDMKILDGGKPAPEEPKDTFMSEIMLTCGDIDGMLLEEQITQEQFWKLIKEVNIYANH